MTRIWKSVLVIIPMLVLAGTWASADDQNLNRAEVTTIKRKLVAVIEALGAPPGGYVKSDESFNLPTSISPMQGGGSFYPVSASADLRFDGGADKMSKQSEKELETEYRQKILAAQAAGNYQAMSEIAQEMTQKMSQAQMAVEEAKRDPIRVNLQFNSSPGATIDPDAVVFEHPGVIALKSKVGGDDEQLQVMVYCDPVKLRETETLSRVDLADNPDPGVKGKTTVRHLTIEMTGPKDVVEEWSKKIDTDKVLAQIDAN